MVDLRSHPTRERGQERLSRSTPDFSNRVEKSGRKKSGLFQDCRAVSSNFLFFQLALGNFKVMFLQDEPAVSTRFLISMYNLNKQGLFTKFLLIRTIFVVNSCTLTANISLTFLLSNLFFYVWLFRMVPVLLNFSATFESVCFFSPDTSPFLRCRIPRTWRCPEWPLASRPVGTFACISRCSRSARRPGEEIRDLWQIIKNLLPASGRSGRLLILLRCDFWSRFGMSHVW